MLSNKSIKKCILCVLFVALPVQIITMPLGPFFSSVKGSLSRDIGRVCKKYTAVVTIAFSGSIIILLSIRRYFKKRKEEAVAKKLSLKREEIEAAKIQATKRKKRRKEQEEKDVEIGIAVDKIQQKVVKVAEAERKRMAAEVRKAEQEAEREAAIRTEREKRKGKQEERQTAIRKLRQQAVRKADEVRIKREVAAVQQKIQYYKQLIPLGDFCAVDRKIGFHCSQLTHSYVKALFNRDVSLQNWINQVNDYLPKERERLAKIVFHAIGSEGANEVRAFEYITNGYTNLAHLLKGNFDAVPGYGQVVRMPDKEAMVIQSKGGAEKKEEIRKSYLHSMISVVWCLYDCALRTGDAFEQGAFHEKSKQLYDFFIRYIVFVNRGHEKMGLFGGNCNNPHAYQRVSTHLKELAKQKNICQYGIDIRFGEGGAASNFLPNKMTHLLFISYDAENYKFILKPEDDCMYNCREIVSHGLGLVRSKLETCFGSSDGEKHQRKERIPKKIMSHFDELMKNASVNDAERDQYNAEVKAWGIQKIVSLADKFSAIAPISQYIEKLKEEYKYADKRFGCEVIFTQEKLKKLVNGE